MRLRWKSELRVGLSPDRAVALRYRRGLGNAICARSLERFEQPSSGPYWTNTVQAFSRLLQPAFARDAELFVVLSNHFARFAVLPWTPALKGEADWLAYARHTLATTYGAQAADWDVRLCPSERRKPRIACGVETELIRSISEVALDAGAHLQSIQPHLAVVFNRLRRTFDRDGAWLAMQEAGRLTLCVLGDRALRAVRSRRTQSDGLKVLARLLAREGLFGQPENPPRRVVLHADEPLVHSDEATPGRIRLEDLTLTRSDPPELRPYALALA